MANAWVEHVRQYAKQHGLTYACAIPYAKESYTKKDGTKSKQTKALPPPKPEPKAKAKPSPPKPEPPKPEPKAKPETATPPPSKIGTAKEEYFKLAKQYINILDPNNLKQTFEGKDNDEKQNWGMT